MADLTVTPSDDLAALARSKPAGTRFLLQPGTYRQGSIQPKDDQQFVAQGEVIFDGDGTRPFAFGGVKGGTGGKRVRLQGFTVQHYCPEDFQSAAIRPFGYAHDWTLLNLRVQDNRHRGIQVDSGWHVIGCQVLRNGCLGIGGGGDALIEDCEIAHNNTEGHDSHNEGGGAKFVYSDELRVENCWVHHNDGPGIWFDGHSTNAQILGNTVWDNHGPGIDYEINAGALIEDNTCQGNGSDPNWADDWELSGGGIVIIDCSGVTIRNNTILDNQGGVGLVDDNRSGRGSWPNLENIDIYGNLIRYAQRKSGIAIASGRPSLSGTVRFGDNRYDVDPARVGFRIAGSNLNFTAWQARWTGERLDTEQEEQGMSQFGAIAGLSVTGVKGPAPVVKPGKPTDLIAQRSISWCVVPGATSYVVQRKIGTDWTLLHTIDGLGMGVPARGRYRVRAVNAAGAGPWAYLLV